MEKSWLNLCVVCLCVPYSAWRKEKDLRTKIVEKHGKSLGYKSFSRDLDVPVFTECNVIKTFTAHGTVANLPGRGWKRKIDERLQWRIVWTVDKEPWSTSKQNQADLETQRTTVSACTIRRHLNEMGRYGRRPRRTPVLTQRHKKARLEFAKTYPRKPKSFWENVMWTDETKVELFGKAHDCTAYRKRNEAVVVGRGGRHVCQWWPVLGTEADYGRRKIK